MTVKIKCCAKINFYLDVVERLEDGYHRIESIFQTVNLCDVLTFKEIKSGIEIITNIPGLPVDSRNIVYKTIRKVQEFTGIKQGIRVELCKNIPICAGLGGGSADSAGTLLALNQMWKLNLTMEVLMQIASSLGSDVPFFLSGGTKAVTGKGEIIRDLIPIPETWVVLVHPSIPLATAKVYNHPALVPREHFRLSYGFSLPFRKAISELQMCRWENVIYNRLEIPAFAIVPELRRIKLKIKRLGFKYVGMTGSGSTFFVVVESKREGQRLRKMLDFKTDLVKTTRMSFG